MTGIDNASPTNQRMIHNTEPKGSDTKGAVLPLNEDRAYPIPKASAPPERRLFLLSCRLRHERRILARAKTVGACCVVLPIAVAAGWFAKFVPA